MAEKSLGDRIWYRRWPKEIPKSLEYPNITLADSLRKTVERKGTAKAIQFLDAVINYNELWDLVQRIAAGLDKLGLKKGDVCALMLPNSFQFVACYYACNLIGVTITPINPTYKSLEIHHQLKDSRAKAAIFLDGFSDELVKGMAGTDVKILIGTNIVDFCKFSPVKVFLGKLLKKIPSGKLPQGAHRLKDIIKIAPNPPKVDVKPEDIALLQYTGGATGVPKGAMLSNYNLIANTVQCDAWLYKRKEKTLFIGVLPLFHIFAMTTIMNLAIRLGFCQVLFPKPPDDYEDFFKVIQNVDKETTGMAMIGIAVLFNKINNHPKVKDYDLTGLEMAINGAGPLPLEIQTKFEAMTGAKLVEGYGLTECSPCTSANPLWTYRKQGTIGLPFPDTDYKIMDSETGTKELPPLPFAIAERGGMTAEQAEIADAYTGELVIKGPQVMAGYFEKEEATATSLRDGWVYTGDIACIDAEGFTIIRDRAKDMIKYKGYAVFPAEVEDILHKHPAINNVAVIGLPHEKVGEIVKAFIILEEDYKNKITTDEIKEWCKEVMTHYKVPSEFELRDELPVTMVGKILRRVLKEEELSKKA